LWPGFRTEFLRLPQADFTVVVIANLGIVDPWRLARAAALLALEGDPRLKPAPAAITQAEIGPLAGTWFNASEPSLFELAWRNGEATVTQNGLPFMLARRADGWLAAERGSFEFALKPDKTDSALVDLGAGRIVRFTRLGERGPVPADLVGTYASADSGAAWTIAANNSSWSTSASGPLIAGGPPWPIHGIDDDTVELATPGNWLAQTQLAHLVRDAANKIVALEVSSGRIKKMRFERQN
jgi:hypothetical protein